MSLDQTTIQNDIEVIVGGSFTPDSLGPDVFESTLQRLRSNTEAYLDAFSNMFLGTNFNAMNQSNLYLPSFLKHAAETVPDTVHALAESLLTQYNSVLVAYDSSDDKDALHKLLPDETVRMFKRLNKRRTQLRSLLNNLS